MSDNKNVDDELQKAIDDINKTTSVDPMFSDPIAAPSTIPEGDTGEMGEPVGPFPAPEPEINLPEPPAPAVPDAPAPAPIDPTTGLNVNQIKEAALRDLLPLVDKLNLGAKERFDLYCDAFKELRDYAILEPAYLAAREIPDDQARAEALLYVVNTIKNM
ncbi:hypothetical protein J6T21_01190 [Candidatus Saccharibacteria bacterium]|nr:hypothetical protein [Candidatus Saccharibacteria bacterium]